ncbi:extensin family protein [Paeniroseomonas aquatica]
MVAYWKLPPEWNPMAPLDLRAEPGPMTRVKLWRLAEDPEACFVAFTASSLALVRVPDRRSEATCMIEDAVLLPNSIMVTPRGPTVTCRMAAAWALFERHSLQRAARQHLGTEIVGVRHLGTYSCRNVNNVATRRRSEHATANAIDIATLVLADGREVRLARDWGNGKPEGDFLRAVRDGACRWFRVVLSPDYNAAHADHFHFDMGPWRTCR